MTAPEDAPQAIAKLEAILARVKSRARGVDAPVMAAPPVAASPVPPVAAPAARAPVPAASETMLASGPATRASGTLEGVPRDRESVELEVSSELIEVDIDVDDEDTLARASAPQTAGLELEVVDEDEDEAVRVPGANEVVEISPSSSPRPVRDADEAFPAPRHTPPPESGRQVASSAPPSDPPSSDGSHTLIGGWQRPSIPGAPPAAAGVRVPAPTGPTAEAAPLGSLTSKDAPKQERPQPFRPEASTQPSSQLAPHFAQPRAGQPLPKAILGPELTRPAPAAPGAVATFEGSAPAIRTQTFGDLLDATLGL